MSVTIRNRAPHKDSVARAHQRIAVAKAIGAVLGVVALGVGATWFVFASSTFAVTAIEVTGASQHTQSALRTGVQEVLGRRTLGFLRPARNILLLNEEDVARLLATAFKNVDDIRVTKQYPHTVQVAVRERIPVGAWCLHDECQYFDATGARWGEAVPSTGPLLILVRDERASNISDPRFFSGISTAMAALPTLDLHPITVTLSDATPGDMRIRVSAGYDIILDAFTNVGDQLSTFAVLVANKSRDSSWKPQYIDLRTPGRVYYKQTENSSAPVTL